MAWFLSANGGNKQKGKQKAKISAHNFAIRHAIAQPVKMLKVYGRFNMYLKSSL